MDPARFQRIDAAPRILFDQIERYGTRPRFMVRREGTWDAVTWSAFGDQTRAIACFLDAFGLEAGQRSAIFAPNSVKWAASALAIQSVGATMVPIYPGNTAEQAQYVLDHSDTAVLFVDSEVLLKKLLSVWRHLDALRWVVLLDDTLDPHRLSAGLPNPLSHSEIAARCIRWNDAVRIGELTHEDDPTRFTSRLQAIDLDTPGLMLYTSGTTGNPKGVPLTHNNVGINARDWLNLQAATIPENSVDLLWLPMSHIFGFGEMCLGNQLGFTSYLCEPSHALDSLPRIRPDVFMSVPGYWEKIAQRARDLATGSVKSALSQVTGGRLRFCLSGGAGLKREIKEFFYEHGVIIIEGYGLTECSPTLTLNRAGDFDFSTVGKVLPSVEVKLADDGEILARGPTVFSGYHKNPEASAEAFDPDGWFKTGDVGSWTDAGFLRIIDRKKDILVTSGGKNIPPSNIEVRFADDPWVEHVVVYGDGKKYLVAGIWPVADRLQDPELEAQLAQSVEQVNAELPRVETIKKFCVMREPLSVDNGLLTASLKVRRKKVYDAFRSDFESLYG